MAKIDWTDNAITDIANIMNWISGDSPVAARRIAERLVEIAGRLDRFPERGRLISSERREIVVVTPYLVRYRIDGDQVTVLEVRHSARGPG